MYMGIAPSDRVTSAFPPVVRQMKTYTVTSSNPVTDKYSYHTRTGMTSSYCSDGNRLV